MSPSHHRWEGEGIVLPLEGVLLDLSTAHRASWRWWARSVGADPDLVAATAEGRHQDDVLRTIAPWLDPEIEGQRLREREALLARTMRRRRGGGALLRAVPPSRRAIRSIAAGGLLDERRRRARLDEAITITADDVAVGPPAPDAHAAAVDAHGWQPARCLALEASAAGVHAAAAAGLTAVYVRAGVDREVPEGSGAVVHSLSALRVELTPEGLRLTFRAESARGW